MVRLGRGIYYPAVLLMLGLLFLQYRGTKPTDYGQLTEIEKISQLRRMNEYPPAFYRLANLIEARPEAVMYFKLEKNFLKNFDLLSLFTSYLHPIFFPFFVIGFFEAVKNNPKPVLFLAFLPIALLTIIGHENPLGPFSLFPIIYGGAFWGVFEVLSKFLVSHEK